MIGPNRAILPLLMLSLPLLLYAAGFDAHYQKITDIKKRKRAFIAVMLPKIHQENYHILKERHFIQQFFKKQLFLNSSRSRRDLQKLNTLARKYRIDDLYDEQHFLKRINQIPVSLVLAQGALESAWGQSRFVHKANNVFGQWTYGKEGMVPLKRAENKRHKIQKFPSINDSIAAYMLNLNRNSAYKAFRNLREQHAQEGTLFSGLEAADTMQNYSGIGREYNEILKKVIRKNHFEQFDNKVVPREF
ncbi:MAG: mannosyl-glycoprotein endo-beta-N-acetylglucosamidase [Sulfurimonas sp.]|nr:MAG: mannosyl-glycoprotein endo-beta-N-acetylglucosamidase [Sulfurimonas sp.]